MKTTDSCNEVSIINFVQAEQNQAHLTISLLAMQTRIPILCRPLRLRNLLPSSVTSVAFTHCNMSLDMTTHNSILVPYPPPFPKTSFSNCSYPDICSRRLQIPKLFDWSLQTATFARIISLAHVIRGTIFSLFYHPEAFQPSSPPHFSETRFWSIRGS